MYNREYWERYLKLDATEMGAKLTHERRMMVMEHIPTTLHAPMLCDVGIGGGRFVRDMKCLGYDINPYAVDWLNALHSFRNPYTNQVKALSFWDSLEHIPEPGGMLNNCREWVFISMPIYKDGEAILRSKHFRKEEHCWYFTYEGLLRFMDRFGFEMRTHSFMETRAGREGIQSFAFRRVR